MDPALREKARRAVDAGLHYLRGQQAADGSVARSVGITALSLRAFLESHRGYNEGDGAFITRQVDFVLSKAKAGRIDQRVAAEHQLQHGRRAERARGDEEPEVPAGDRGRPQKFLIQPPDRRGRRLQAGSPLLRRDRLRRRRAARHVERVPRAGGPQGHVDRPEGSRLAEGAGVREPLAEPQREQRPDVGRQRRRVRLHARLEPARIRERRRPRPTAA